MEQIVYIIHFSVDVLKTLPAPLNIQPWFGFFILILKNSFKKKELRKLSVKNEQKQKVKNTLILIIYMHGVYSHACAEDLLTMHTFSFIGVLIFQSSLGYHCDIIWYHRGITRCIRVSLG